MPDALLRPVLGIRDQHGLLILGTDFS
jgi:hypothetical protein